MNARKWWYAEQIDKLYKPVDRTEWDMTPQTYNAYYNPSNNEIVLPAAIFTVPGFKDEELDDALVYGYAGASTIGHEITHGFDDEDVNLTNMEILKTGGQKKMRISLMPMHKKWFINLTNIQFWTVSHQW